MDLSQLTWTFVQVPNSDGQLTYDGLILSNSGTAPLHCQRLHMTITSESLCVGVRLTYVLKLFKVEKYFIRLTAVLTYCTLNVQMVTLQSLFRVLLLQVQEIS